MKEKVYLLSSDISLVSQHDNTSAPSRTVLDPSRRAVLTALGAGVAVSLAGCTTDAEPSAGTPTPEPTTLDGQFGFVGRSMDVTPPVEPTHEVEALIAPREDGPVPEFYFEPTGLFVDPGDVVQFSMTTPDHTVTAYHPHLGRTRRVPDDVPAISSPVLGAGAYWLYQFETPGVYDLYCAPHEPFGMAFRVVVGEAGGPGATPVSEEEPAHGDPRPPYQTAATVLRDAALAPENIVDAGRVSWSDLAPESRQLQG